MDNLVKMLIDIVDSSIPVAVIFTLASIVSTFSTLIIGKKNKENYSQHINCQIQKTEYTQKFIDNLSLEELEELCIKLNEKEKQLESQKK